MSPSQEGSSGQEDSSVHNISYVDYHYEASEFEKKLIQVAEMHGELLEFNEHLQVCMLLSSLCLIKSSDTVFSFKYYIFLYSYKFHANCCSCKPDIQPDLRRIVL